ncbi:MAG: adenylyl-sulfate kinase [Nitrospirota bacterium]
MNGRQNFAVWITGLPSSGKSSITRELVKHLEQSGIFPVVLESDVLRSILTPHATYHQEERDRFYLQMAQIGALLVDQGRAVIFDATANKRTYRDRARALITLFIEVFVQCPLDVCRSRDLKGIYAAAADGTAANVPGVQAVYEPPQAPELTVDCRDDPRNSAGTIIAHLKRLHHI